MEKITSRANNKVKYACSLKNSGVRKKERKILAEGVRLCNDALKSGCKILMCFVTGERALSPSCTELIEAAEQAYVVSPSVAEKLSDTEKTQGVFCVIKKPELSSFSADKGKFIFLERLQDPGNLGTVLRTAEAFGLSGAILCGCCDEFSPKALRSSMGAVFRLPIYKVENAEEYIINKKKDGFSFFVSVPDNRAQDIKAVRNKDAVITAVGNEGNGISEGLKKLGAAVSIKMNGRAESLNASQAATVIMYEMTKDE